MSCLVLKPCCLPHVSLGKQWSLGGYVFPVKPVAVRGRHAGGRWVGESRAEMAPKFGRWVDNLTSAVDVGQGGRKRVLRVPFGGSPCVTGALGEATVGKGWGREQSGGGGGELHELARYQNAYIVGERGFMRGGDGNEEQRAQQAARASEARQASREAAEQEIGRVLGVIAAEGAAGREKPGTWGSKICLRILGVGAADKQRTASDEPSETDTAGAGAAGGWAAAALKLAHQRQPDAAGAGLEGALEAVGAGDANSDAEERPGEEGLSDAAQRQYTGLEGALEAVGAGREGALAASDAGDASGDEEEGPGEEGLSDAEEGAGEERTSDAEEGAGEERTSDAAQRQYKRLARLIHPEEGGRGLAGAAEAFAAVRAAIETLRALGALPRYLGVAVDKAETETLLLPWLHAALAAAGGGGEGRGGAGGRRVGGSCEEDGDVMCALAALAGQRVEEHWRVVGGGGADGQVGQGYHVTLWHGAEHGLQAFDTAMAALEAAPV